MGNQYSRDYDLLDKIAYDRICNGESLSKVAKSLQMNRDKLHARLKKKYNLDVSSRKDGKKHVNSNYFEKWNRENAYWFGLILADGNIGRNLSSFELTLKDKDHIQKFKDCIESEHAIGLKKVNGKSYYRISIKDKTFVKFLYEKGIFPNKSNINFPMPYIPDEFLNDFLRGLIDGDGMYYLRYTSKNKTKQSPYIKISIGFHCVDYLKSLSEKIESFYNVTLGIQKQKTAYCITISAIPTKKMIKLLYKDTNLYLERKYQKIKQFLQKEGDAK